MPGIELVVPSRPSYFLREQTPLHSCPARAEITAALAMFNHGDFSISDFFHCGHQVHVDLGNNGEGSAIRYCNEMLSCLAQVYAATADHLVRTKIRSLAEQINARSVGLSVLDLDHPAMIRAALEYSCIEHPAGSQKDEVCWCAPHDQVPGLPATTQSLSA